MFGGIEIGLLTAAAGLLLLGMMPRSKPYRSLFGGGSALMLISAVFPRDGNPLGRFLFGTDAEGPHLPPELFGFVWWILGAWLVKSVLDLFLRRTFFPNNDEPHARRLFADLASGLIYVLAGVGIIGTVFKQPVSTFLATSGVVAIVLGLALQNTLGDVLSGLAINIERPFGAGDWISLGDAASGQVIQVNWRATRIRTWSNDMIVVPNSVVSKAVVTNHSRPRGPHYCIIRLKVDLAAPPARVIEALLAAASDSPDIAHGTEPRADACDFSDSLVVYELAFAIDSFAIMPEARSEMLRRVADAFRARSIRIGAPAMDVRIIGDGDVAVANNAAPASIPSLSSKLR